MRRRQQAIGQSAKSEQEAAAISATFQEKPSNSNTPVRVLSKGDDGSVEQTNEATSDAFAGNLNVTKQTAIRSRPVAPGIQAIGQSAKSEQGAFALGLTIQQGASNENAPVRVLSKGDWGSVSQANIASSDAVAANVNWTEQKAGQTQEGVSCCCWGNGDPGDRPVVDEPPGRGRARGHGAARPRAAVQLQERARSGNSNEPTRVLSQGDDGAVRQSNVATSDANGVNWNVAKQDASQIEATRCGA